MTKVPVKSLNERRYAETFAVFLEQSREYPLMLEHLAMVVRKLPRGLRLLDIGAGTGCLIQSLLSQSGITIERYLGIEANAQHARLLSDTLECLPISFADVLTEAFGPTTQIQETFDLALFSHSLYGMAEPVARFLQGASCLKPGGIALAYLQGPYGDYALQCLFEPHFDRDKPALENGMSSHELVMGLRQQDIHPTVCYLPSTLDMTGLFEPEQHQRLSEFISFCLLVEFESVPAPLRDDIVQYLRAACIELPGRLLWHAPTAAIMIPARIHT